MTTSGTSGDVLTEQLLKNVVSEFAIEGDIAGVKPYGSGHINDTYHVTNADSRLPDYLLQRVNSYVFKDVPLLISNIEIVTSHIREKLKAIEGSVPDKQVLTLIKTTKGQSYCKDDAGNYWRMYLFLKDTISYNLVTTCHQAYEGGKAFGRFQSLIADLDPKRLGETIPDFHNIEMRLSRFEDVLINDTEQRVSDITTEIAFVRERGKSMCAILNLGRAGKIPLRITHNDTKFNNVLLDQQDHAQCVIDLDTVMPGFLAYDFGDAIRTIVNTCAEDEAETAKIDVNINFFEAFTNGFMEQTAAFLNAEEINSLPLGALLLPFMVGLRFLTDYLEGDKYFKIHFEGHNLQRARAQFQLLQKLEEQFPRLQEIVQQASVTYTERIPNE